MTASTPVLTALRAPGPGAREVTGSALPLGRPLSAVVSPAPQRQIVLTGTLDHAGVVRLRAALLDMRAACGPRPAQGDVVVDVSGLDVDLEGLRLLVAIDRALDQHGSTLVLRKPSKLFMRMIASAGLLEALPIEPA